MADDLRTWPTNLRRIAEVIGPAEAVRFADRYGGIEKLYIPKTPRDGHKFLEVISMDAFTKLCHAFGGDRIEVAKGAFRNSLKVDIAEADGSTRKVAEQTGASMRYVRMVRATQRETLPLFDGEEIFPPRSKSN